MKKLLIISSLLFIFHCSFAQVKISGKVKNAKSQTIELSYFQTYTNENEVLKCPIKPDGSFEFVFDIDLQTLILINIGGQRSPYLRITPNQEFFINLDEKEAKIFDKVTFSGKDAPVFDFQMAFIKEFKTGGIMSFTNFKEKDISEPAKYLVFCDSIQKVLESFIDAYQTANSSLSVDYANEFKKRVVYRMAEAKMNYPALHAFHNNQKENLKVSEGYYDFTNKLTINADSLTHLGEFTAFAQSYIDKKYFEMMYRANHKKFPLKNRYEQYKIIFTGKTLNMIAGNLIYSSFRLYNFQEVEAVYKDFISWSNNTKQNDALTKLYEKAKRFAAGSPAPNFTLRSMEGKEVSLADFKGKVIYLDFWASWCAPCIKEFPAAKKLKEKFKDREVVFLYISIDEDEKNWKDGIEKHQVDGVNLYGKGNQVTKEYNISGIPAYFLIDKQANFFTSATPRPSSPNIEKMIEEALSAK